MNFVGWIDHDPHQEDAILRSLGSIKGQDARDELGLGTIRDSFADLFFPGLSTIQQRVRYFLMVQWCCEHAASQGDADRILSRLRETEEALIRSLKHLGEGHGVIGIQSQEDLERMPSEIYWNGLLVLQMRRMRGNRKRWARQVALIRTRPDPLVEDGVKPKLDIGFDAERPSPPQGFPTVPKLNFDLSPEEADFLRDRLSNACVDPAARGHKYNLFGVFSRHRRKINVPALWHHPRMPALSSEAQGMVMLAGAFARVMYGAVILYNVCVARLTPKGSNGDRLRATHETAFLEWAKDLNPADVDLLARRILELAPLGLLTRHGIDDKAVTFVRKWTAHSADPHKLLDDADACRLVSEREVYLKLGSGTSRIRSAKQRERWSGESGSQQMDFRWLTAQSCLNDLAAARA